MRASSNRMRSQISRRRAVVAAPARCALVVGIVAVLGAAARPVRSDDYALAFSTFLGGNGDDQGRGIAADKNGNVYVVGGTSSANFPSVNGTPVNTQLPTDPACRQNMDAFVAKFSPAGQLVWSTALGGPNYDRGYEVALGGKGNVYVAGRGGIGFPVTPGAFQTQFCGVPNAPGDPYGHEESFVAKLDHDGKLLWASFVGEGPNLRSFAVDPGGDVFVQLSYYPTGAAAVPDWYGGAAFANAYQKTPNPQSDSGIARLSSDGKTVKGATWLFGKDDGRTGVGCIRLDSEENVYFLGNTTSTTLFTSDGATQRTYGGGPGDLYLAKLSADGSALLYATYFGGSGNEYNNTHNLAVDQSGLAYTATQTTSLNLPTTPGTYQSKAKHAAGTIQVSKFSATGGLLACTYLGGSTADNVDGVSVDREGNVYLSGDTRSVDFPVTPGAYQTTKGAGMDAVFVKLTSDLTALAYSTFLGGAAGETGRDNCVDDFGNYYLIGQANGAGWPLVRPYQNAFAGGVSDDTIAVFTCVRIG